MSYLKPNTAGVYDIPSANIDTLYVKGKKFQQYINELVFEDQLEAGEITEIKLLLEYLDTTGLNTAWTVTNSNVNETLRSAITALQTKLVNIDSSALTQSSVLTNDNRNSVLKTAIDTATSDLSALSGRVTTAEGDIDNLETRMTTAEGDIDGVEAKTRYIATSTNSAISGIPSVTPAYIKIQPFESNEPIRAIDLFVNPDESEARGYLTPPVGRRTFMRLVGSLANSLTTPNYNRIEMKTANMIMEANNIKITCNPLNLDTITAGEVSVPGSIIIGAKSDNVEIGTEPPNSSYEQTITIGANNIPSKSTTVLKGKLNVDNCEWLLPKSDKFTWTQLASLIPTVGVPLWIVSFALTSVIPNFEYSDVFVMKDGGAVSNKAGDITTSNEAKLKTLVIYNSATNIARLTPVEGTFVASGTISKTTLNGSIRNSVFLDGGGDNKIAFKHHNIAASDIADWALTEANDKCNVIEIGGNSGILIHQGASNSETPLQIINSKSGSIKLSLGNDGTKGATLPGLEVMRYASSSGSATRIGYYPLAEPTGSQQLEINQPLNRDGIVVQYYTYPAGATKNIINYNSINTPGTITGINLVGSSSVSTPSLVISGNYTGDTTNRLYKNADNKLFWNGVQLGSNLGGGGGGIEYYIPLANNVTNPAPNPTAQIATETYTNAPQRTITQSTTAVATGLRMARYLTGLIDKESNPFVEGLQTIQQYLTWNQNNIVGQLYGQAWFQAEATGAAFVYDRTYPGGVSSAGGYVLNGTPILAPGGLFNLSVKSVVFPGITIDTFSGLTMTLKCRLEARDLVTENWNILQTSTSSISYSLDNQYDQTLTFTEDFIHNQTTTISAPTAYRFVLFTTSSNSNGAFLQVGAGSTGSDLGAYKLGSTGGTSSIRILLYNGENAKQTITHTTTPLLVPIELPISPLYEIGAFNGGRLGFDVFMYQPSGQVHANHQMRFFFGEGTISHIESTSSLPDPIPTLAQVLNSGATASQTINMNGNAITGITTLEGSSNGNWNVKQITAGTGVSVSPTSGTYTIANTGVLSVAAASGTPGISVSTANGVATLQNSGILSVAAASGTSGISVSTANGIATLQNSGILSVASASGSGISVSTTSGAVSLANTGVLSVASASGSGISVSTANGVATLANTGILSISQGSGITVSTSNGVATISSLASTVTQTAVLQNIRDDNLALGEVGALPRKPDYWATNWSIADTAVRTHYDTYVSVDGKVIATASGNFTIRYSTNWGFFWNNGNVGGGYLSWYSICGTTSGSKLFAFGRTGTTGQTLVLYTSLDQGQTWTQVTSSAFTGLNTVGRVRCSGDGRYLIANVGNVGTGGRYLFSNDSGVTWTLKTIDAAIVSGFTQGVNVSRSGAVQYITWANQDGNISRIYRSLDYGTTWTQLAQHSGSDIFTYIESDATGRFVYVTRYVNVSTPVAPAARSEDYGNSFSNLGLNGIEDFWVSATGQFLCGVSNPQTGGGASYLYYSDDYGRTYSAEASPASSVSNLYRTISGNADGSILVLGSPGTESGFSGDGKIRIARQGQPNISDLSVTVGGGTIAKVGGVYTLTIEKDYSLHYAGILTADNNTNTYNLSWSNIVSAINLETHNIRYEIFISFNYSANQIDGGVAFQMGLNGVDSTGYAPPADTRRRTAVTNWTNTIVAGQANPDTAQEFNQTFIDRFYCGERRSSTWTTQFRNRVHMKGEISMNRRLNAEAGITDDSIQSRIIVNQFNCEHFVDAGSGQWYIYAEAGINNAEQYNRIHGTALWNARANNLWANNLATGITSINIFMQTIGTPITYMPRGAEIQFRIYKENKGIVNSV